MIAIRKYGWSREIEYEAFIADAKILNVIHYAEYYIKEDKLTYILFRDDTGEFYIDGKRYDNINTNPYHELPEPSELNIQSSFDFITDEEECEEDE